MIKAFDLMKFLERQRDFSRKTFGPGDRTKGIIAKYLNLPEAVVRDSELPRFVATLDPAQMQWWIDVLSRQDMLRTKLDPVQLIAK